MCVESTAGIRGRSHIGTNFDKRSKARAKLITKAKEEAEKMGADAIVGTKLETNTDTGVAGTVPSNSTVC